jgi:hypothetical protein
MRPSRSLLLMALFLILAPLGGSRLAAQDGGAGSFEVSGVEVDVSARTAGAARLAGWRLAQRKGWTMLSRRMGGGDGTLPDGVLDQLVSGIVVESEQIGPTRYIARLGIRFDRSRAASILGVSAAFTRSPPFLLLPIMWTGGAPVAFERKSAWLDAWGRFNAGSSTIDYVRPAATGPDALLLNAGQINRPGRGQWRSALAQYGASDVLIPIVHLERQWPGGPIIGRFQARFGPDNRLLESFSLRVSNADALPALMEAGVKRIDAAYQSALSSGILRIDPALLARAPAAEEDTTVPDESLLPADVAGASEVPAVGLVVQVDTPTANAFDASQATLRGIPGVRGVAISSLALGGISVLRVSYEGDAATLRTALEARGWSVITGNGALRISRRAPGLPPPDVPADNATAG